MKYTKYKLFFAWEYEKEEQWLNEMSAKGLQLVHAGFCKYVFQENSEDKFIYRLELLNNYPSHQESVSYIHFLEEAGVEHVDTLFRWAYFRKNAKDGKFELYSDTASKINHYKRILFLFIMLMPLNIVNGINTLSQYIENGHSMQLTMSILCFMILSLLGTGSIKILHKIHKLNTNKLIKE